MQHSANSSMPFGSRLPGSLHTPSQSFSELLQTPNAQALQIDWAERQVKEHESIKSRLSDLKFNIREYADPLLPRQYPRSHYYPRGVTAEMEKHLLDVIANIKASKA
ncbi:hypothetical protein GGR50DRAFT_651537 [Xylaria sp. CBS 124048]|nr:hypothetical protein GGR50DRAFT_651537 [Xylaria sp. CBS 124048]